MKYLNKIIYEENEDGSIKESNLENFMLKKEFGHYLDIIEKRVSIVV